MDQPTTRETAGGVTPSSVAGKAEDRRREVLRGIFRLFEQAGIAYCVMDGYDRAPDDAASGDVDCIVTPDVVPRRVAEVLHNNAWRLGVQIVGWSGAPNHYVTLAARDAGGTRCFVGLDLHPGYERYGRPFLPAAAVLGTRRRHRGAWVPSADVEFAYLLVKKMVNRTLDEQHALRLTELFRGDVAACERWLADLWNRADARFIASGASSGDWRHIIDGLPRLRAGLLQHVAVRHPALLLRARAAGVVRRVRRMCLPPQGLHVVLLGPDGAGKSTVIDGLTRVLAPVFDGGVETHTVAGLMTRKATAVGRPHDKSPRPLLPSIAKAAYWFLYYAPGYLVTVWPALHRDTLYLNHRYIVDALVDPRRYRYGGPRWLLRLVWRGAIKPHLIVLLDAPPTAIRARKREVAPEETERQCLAYRSTVATLEHAYVADASRPADVVIGDVVDAILRCMALRTARRLALEPPAP